MKRRAAKKSAKLKAKWGGKRRGAGKRKKPVDPQVARAALAEIGELEAWLEQYKKASKSRSSTEAVRILTILRRFGFGDPVATVNHIHDKPIEMNVTVSLAEAIQKARKRASG